MNPEYRQACDHPAPTRAYQIQIEHLPSLRSGDTCDRSFSFLPQFNPLALAHRHRYSPTIKTDETFTIRPALLADASTIARFNVLMARETESRKLPPARVRKGVHALLSDQTGAKGIYFVAESKGKVIGQLMVTYEWSDWRNGNFWWIQSVYVAKSARRKGVFKALFRNVLEKAKSDKFVCGVRLYVDSHNSKAQQTYAALGMTGTDYQVYETDFTK